MGEDADNEHLIKIKGYFGFSPANPSDNYMYVEVNKLTLKDIMAAFELDFSTLPTPLQQTGFPNGLVVSYSLLGKNCK